MFRWVVIAVLAFVFYLILGGDVGIDTEWLRVGLGIVSVSGAVPLLLLCFRR
jgi:ABC-type anion transport system duplicated permease subunit